MGGVEVYSEKKSDYKKILPVGYLSSFLFYFILFLSFIHDIAQKILLIREYRNLSIRKQRLSNYLSGPSEYVLRFLII